jgi:hypothetical protein
MNAVKRRGLGLCEGRKGVIGKVKRGVRRVRSRLAGVENVSESRRDGRPLTPRRAVESRARVISNSLRSTPAKKNCAIDPAAT